MIARLRKLSQLLGRASKKPLLVIFFRIRQSLILAIYTTFGIFSGSAARVVRRWRQPGALDALRAEDYLLSLPIRRDGIEAIRAQLEGAPQQKALLEELYSETVSGRITIFGTQVEVGGAGGYPWCTDWRFGHRWPNRAFQTYDFYEYDKTVPYDVKFPWELSRLNFLVAPSLLAVIDERAEWWDHLDQVLADWQDNNPIAHSIGWRAMEVAMRGVNLSFLANLAIHAGGPAEQALRRIMALCEIHGGFLFQALEYSDIRGNHYAANLAALIMLGSLLSAETTAARRWLKLGGERLGDEILLQYCADGVQIEKSIPYHRLVTELFMLSAIALEAKGISLGSEAKGRLRKACEYSAAYTRPDGLAPMWGDNDDARALWFDLALGGDPQLSGAGQNLRDHRGLLFLGAAFLNAPDLVTGCPPPEFQPLAVLLLLPDIAGRPGEIGEGQETAFQHFASGGMVTAREKGIHLVMDVGEVGLKGRGGHGHLDALSFELSLDGIALIVDPGSYIYTGDPAARDEFRATGAHNVLRVDCGEMADLPAKCMWRLGCQADPHDVIVRQGGNGFEVKARHSGYSGLPDPVIVTRDLVWDRGQALLRITDCVVCDGQHNVERFFHLAPALKAKLDKQTLMIYSPEGRCYTISWDEQASAELRKDWVSENYASKIASLTLVLSYRTQGSVEFVAAIGRASG